MNKLYVFLALVLACGAASGQTRFQQITIDGGVGATQAYAGAASSPINPAVYGGLSYYPIPDIYLQAAAQAGLLAGHPLQGAPDRKSFSNKYMGFDADVNVRLGIFFDYQNNDFLNVIKNFYAGAGIGYMSCRITNAEVSSYGTTDHLSNNLKYMPIRTGYEFNLLHNQYGTPLLKINLSTTFYYVADRGLDGYYDPSSKPWSLYMSYSVTAKYTFTFHGLYGHRYNRYD